jgi:hypothetical protein
MRRDVIHVTCPVFRVSRRPVWGLPGTPETVGSKQCEQCGTNILYCDRHDAYFCSTRDAWAETACSGPSCTYCLGRPNAPSSCNHPDRHYGIDE